MDLIASDYTAQQDFNFKYMGYMWLKSLWAEAAGNDVWASIVSSSVPVSLA